MQIYNSLATIISNQNTTNTNLNFTFPEGSFSWRVKASNGSESTLYSSNTILIDTTAPNVPILSAPTNASSASGTSLNFQWSRVLIPGSNEYDKIYIYKDAALTNLQSETQATSPFNTSLTSGTYYWFVKGFDAAGNESARSSVFSVIIN